MKSKLVAAIALLFCIQEAGAQTTRYLVRLRNKGFNTHTLANPATYLSARAIARRTQYGIPLDSTDLPVTKRYLDSIASVPNVTMLNASKWLNTVSIQTSDAAAITRINGFSFVQSVNSTSFRMSGTSVGVPGKFVQPLERDIRSTTAREQQVQADAVAYGASGDQIKIHNGNFLHNIGLKGEGMIIGMLDAGYQNYLSVSSLDSARTQGRILDVYDFVALDGSVNEDNAHGEQCFSTIAANIPGSFVGGAFHAQYYLIRTEDAATETPIEEFNWSCGAERVDSSGGDIISSSLGYYNFDAPFNTQNHPFSQFDGNTTMPAIAADLAAKKGILVLNAAGNEGNSAWGRIITPADADSILAVGAVTYSGTPASFTSRGPSADGQVKPDVASVGVQTIIQYPGGGIGGGNGTSFATPNLAGLVTCLWQGFREFNNMKIIDAVRRAGNRYTTPNDTTGYGIPDLRKALMQLTADYSTATVTNGNACKNLISWNSKDVSAMQYQIERKVPGATSFTVVGTVSGQGSVFANQSHTFIDDYTLVPSGTTEYRIRQVFDTATSTYASAIIDQLSISLSGACTSTAINTPALSENGIVLMPNPSRGAFAIRVTVPSALRDVQLRVTDAEGKTIHLERRSLPAGTSHIPVNLSRYAGGKYYVTLYGNGQLLGTRELVRL